MTNQIRQLLARSPALARVREGLIRVLSGVEGVTATEGERDSLGRPATRYDQPSIDGTVLSLFVDAGSARLLEEVTVVGTDGIAEPTGAPVAPVAPAAPAVPESTPEPQLAPRHSALPGDIAVLDDGAATLVVAPAPTVSAAVVLSRSSHARWLILGTPRTARGSRGAS